MFSWSPPPKREGKRRRKQNYDGSLVFGSSGFKLLVLLQFLGIFSHDCFVELLNHIVHSRLVASADVMAIVTRDEVKCLSSDLSLPIQSVIFDPTALAPNDPIDSIDFRQRHLP
ncbi:hypothetical protein DKX38_007520 [Salix brachista]|uniref:Uncharacterized protein n=1 Tax=Salix brachista TaxID=2182728 RepID=A0A5N5MQZ7_9ROSI|nr:hypothetical protein DKX38_007520 [Salix brachista]